jgi:hypothetical protein
LGGAELAGAFEPEAEPSDAGEKVEDIEHLFVVLVVRWRESGRLRRPVVGQSDELYEPPESGL